MIVLIISIFFFLIILLLGLLFWITGYPVFGPVVPLLICDTVLLCMGISRVRKKRRMKRLKERFGAVEAAVFTHITGLPFADGAKCTVLLRPQEFLFLREGTQVHLPFAKILDVARKTEEEIRNSYVSNIGHTVAGYAAFGTLGAIIGGQPQQITDRTTKWYLMFAYDKDGETAGIALDSRDAVGTDSRMAQYYHEHKSAEGRRNIQL